MARTAVTVQQMSRAGIAPSYATPDAANGEAIPNNGTTFLHVKNAAGAGITVTIITQGTVDCQAIADRTVTVPQTTGDRMIGPFPVGIYGDTLQVDYSSATSVTRAAINLPS